MNLELADKVVLVTASSKGLGRGIIEAYLTEGSKVVITGTNKEDLEKEVKKLNSHYGSDMIISYVGDLTISDNISECIKYTLYEFGRIDILVANLGSGQGRSGWNLSEDEWTKMLDKNFNGARRITEQVLPIMIEQNSGSIVYISSITGKEVIGAPIHYNVAKAALISYSKSLSRKVAVNNIRVNTVCPGNIYFEDGTWDLKLRENKEKVLDMLEKTVPLNRFSTPAEIANLVLFVSSNKLSFMTGSCIIIDGGQTVSI